MSKSDREYRESNLRTEEARLAWEVAMYRCCQVREEGEREGGREEGREEGREGGRGGGREGGRGGGREDGDGKRWR